MRQTKEKAAQTKRDILNAALELFVSQPFAEVSVSSVAEAAGVTKGAIYGHFANKNDILLQLIRDHFTAAEREYFAALNFDEGSDNLKTLYQKMLMLAISDDTYKKECRLLERCGELPEEIKSVVHIMQNDSLERERQMVEGFIGRAQRDGRIRSDSSPKKLAWVITSTINALRIMVTAELLPPACGEYTDYIFDSFAKDLAPARI